MAAPDLPITSYALLGLLTFGDELTGYELKQRADSTMRFYWTAPAMSQVYTELGRLTDHGLLRRQGEGRGTTYALTPKGRRAAADWMREQPVGLPVFKHPQALRLMTGHLTDPATLVRMLGDYVEEVTAEREVLAEVRRSLEGREGVGEPFHFPAIVADWGLSHFDNEIVTARQTIKRLRDEE